MPSAEAKRYCIVQILLGIIACFVLLITDAIAQDSIPKKSGIGAQFVVMPGIYFVKSQVLSSGAPLLGDVGNASIPSLNEAPKSETIAALPLAGELSYTFSKTRTQLYFGNRLVDIIRLDGVLAFGIRQEIGKGGILAASFLFTPFELNFWEDPFVENETRIPTAMNLPGVRLRWGKVFQTNLELTISARKFQYDVENSGKWLLEQGRLNENELNLLNRNGEALGILATYKFNLNQHYLKPGFRFNLNNYNGDAISNNRSTFLLGYGYRSTRFLLDAKALIISRTADETHPVFEKRLSSNGFGFAVATKIPIKVLTHSIWSIILSAEYVREDFNTDFYSSRIAALTGGVLWRLKAP